MGSYIHSIEYYLPERILDNNTLAEKFPEWSADKIFEKIGILNRHIVSDQETALDLACYAAEKILKNYDKKLIDFVILCTQSPDYYLPTSACILQDRLGLRKEIGAFDFNLGCSGYIYGLAIAKSLVNTKIASNVLFITSETYSRHIHESDKSNRSIFGDGAAATIILSSPTERIHEFVLGTDGSGKNNLIVRKGGINWTDSPDRNLSEDYLFMNGPEIFNFTLDIVPSLVGDVLEKNNTIIEEIDFCIFHQANKFILEYLRKKLKIDPAKFYINMLETGNTVSATIPIAIKNSIETGLVKAGDKVLLVGFGVGYSWGATIVTI